MSDFYFYLHFKLITDLRLNLSKSSNQPPPVHIMVNPNRGGAWRGGYVNGRGSGGGGGPRSVVAQNPTTHVDSVVSNGVSTPSHNNSNRGGMLPRGGRGSRGRGFGPGVDRGRGMPRGSRGSRGRGSFPAPQVAS